MKRLFIFGALVLSVVAPAAALGNSVSAVTPPAFSAPQLLAFRGFHLGGGGFGRRHSVFAGLGRRGSHHVLRRIAHALVFAYILHLFFSRGGFSILLWLLVIGLIVHFVRRGRRRRAQYAS